MTSGIRVIANPGKPLKPLLSVLTDVASSVDKALAAAGPVPAGYENFDRAIVIRGENLLKAIVLLSEQLFWEVAASSARQMFELVLNMEALAAMPDREEATFRYSMYGLMQQTRAQIVRLDYERASGRVVDEDRAAKMATLLASPSFDTFKGKAKANGSPNWHSSWNGKNARDMALASKNSIREAQYNQLFVSWSEEAHAAPAAHMASTFRTVGPGWADEVISDDLREAAQVASMALMLFFELWMSLVNVPAPDPDALQDWFNRTNAYMNPDDGNR
jgi:hypothetical protein